MESLTLADDGTLRLRYLPFPPHPKQWAMLAADAKALAFGGAGGGGKTTALLMGAAQYADVPGYEALLVRANYTDITLPGSIGDAARQWFSKWAKPKKVNRGFRYEFPNGGAITIIGAPVEKWDDEILDRKYQFVGLDEAQEFDTDTTFRYSMARLRPPAPDLTEIQALSLFGPASDGTLITEVQPRLRIAFTFYPDLPQPAGAVWVHRVILDRETREVPLIPSTFLDNPAIDPDEYAKALSLLPQKEQDRLMSPPLLGPDDDGTLP